MNKKISLGAALSYMAILVALTFAITIHFSMQIFNRSVYNIKERETMYQKVAEIDRLVRGNYYDTINENALMDALASGYVAGLQDPNAQYMTPEDYDQYLMSVDGSYVGIGVRALRDDSDTYIYVDEVYPDSPAANAGLMEGDLIVQIDGEDINNENLTRMIGSLTGDMGTRITLVYRREAEDSEPLEIIRRQVEIPTVYSSVYDRVGYLRITHFSTATPNQFDRALSQVINTGVQGVIFDLRDNTGGNLDAVMQILDTLVGQGKLLSAVYNSETVVLYESSPGQLNMPMVVLVNENTSDVAEVFAQVLKDYRKAFIVGDKTAGVGRMQSVWKLSDGSAVLLTVAIYQSPSGHVIEGNGITPDYEVSLSEGQMFDPDMVEASMDAQFNKALELALASITSSVPTEDQSEADSSALPESSAPVESSQDDESSESADESEDSGESDEDDNG